MRGMLLAVWIGLLAIALLGPAQSLGGSTAGKSAAADFPQVALSNGIVKMAVYLPDAEKGYYRGLRFDWSGIIARADYRGHTFFGEWRKPHNPTNHDDVTGPAEEFGPTAPLGYADARVGEPFVKIGVGEVEKIDEPAYRFWYPYKLLRPGTWKVRHGKGWIEFRQDFEARGGWAYHYEKRIALADAKPEFSITHRFKNTGARRIESDLYCHNFTLIDDVPVGPDYRLILPFEASAKERTELKDLATIQGREILFQREFKEGESIMAFLGGLRGRVDDYRARIENRKTGATLEIRGDAAPARFNVWATRTALCPEPFIDLRLATGEERAWRTEYLLVAR
jgi:hypothetical protein